MVFLSPTPAKQWPRSCFEGRPSAQCNRFRHVRQVVRKEAWDLFEFFGQKTRQNCILFNQLNSSPAMSPLRHRSVFGAKSAPNGQLRKFVFSCQTLSVVPEPPDSLVFGRKQAPDACCALPIPSRRACHRSSPLRHRSLLGRKSAQKRPSSRVLEDFVLRRVFHGTTASRGPCL